ncbi:MAG: hypothetical protein V4714_09840 [Bacteroidota bacterium]
MKTGLIYIKIVAICVVMAAMLRMYYPRVTYFYFPHLLGEPYYEWLWAIFGIALVEVIYFIWAYMIAGTSYLYFERVILKHKLTLPGSVLLGLLHGAIWYVIFAILLRELHKSYFYYLIFAYSIVGALFGFLYYWWITRKVNQSIKQPTHD